MVVSGVSFQLPWPVSQSDAACKHPLLAGPLSYNIIMIL